MPDYSKSLIYKICCKDTSITDIYIGSTTNLIKRKSTHKKRCVDQTAYVYQFIRKNGNWENWETVVIEEYPCNSRQQLFSRERYWKEELDSSLNMNKPVRTNEEKRLNNIKTSRTYDAKFPNRCKEYYIKNKNEISKKNKIYREKNKKIIKIRQHLKYEKNKYKYKIKYTCECGVTSQICNKKKHERTKKHLNFINNLKKL